VENQVQERVNGSGEKKEERTERNIGRNLILHLFPCFVIEFQK
jgi:hypothetical protein